MSLAINPREVTAVLLTDGWHTVRTGTFTIDSYEYVRPSKNPDKDGLLLHGGGHSGVCAAGFEFTTTDSGEIVCGPLTSIHAVRVVVSDGE